MIERKNVSLEKITKIEPVGFKNCCDLTIPKNHNFFANNILVHNTGVLEEHSDTCVLLHWQNFYDHKDENFNEFKIIIAKQRNGRTGEYIVHYEPKHYRFSEVGGEEEPMKQKSFLEESEAGEKALEIFGGQIV